VWFDWVDDSRKAIQHACDVHGGTPLLCAKVLAQVHHIEHLEHWALALLAGMALVLLWMFVDHAWRHACMIPCTVPVEAQQIDLSPLRGRL
jgi:hypothetical protein